MEGGRNDQMNPTISVILNRLLFCHLIELNMQPQRLFNY